MGPSAEALSRENRALTDGVSALHKERAPHPSHHEAALAVNQVEALTHHAGSLNSQGQSWGKECV